jgi:hypothetical protein
MILLNRMIKSANFFAGWLGMLLIAGGHSLFAQANGQAGGSKAELNRLQTVVCFHTSDAALQRLFDAAETKGAANIVRFTPAMKVLVEGGAYNNAWIETQPMGGSNALRSGLDGARSDIAPEGRLCQRPHPDRSRPVVLSHANWQNVHEN